MPITLNDEAAQVAFGEMLGQALAGRGQVHLIGDLGAGKTTLARGILRAYGHDGAVKSPTYTLVEPYETASARIFHFDLYRLGDPEELEFMGARDMLGSDALCLIEWPSRGAGWLPVPDLEIHLQLVSDGRRVAGTAYSQQGRAALARMPASLSHKEDEC
ncbi:MAG: tRNA (adenosine(37)-N6)-threonylcarbamoyltransferase complex ATPase subunit type 1 TsaE [Salinicola sp.]|uniref:tRNA (adenosine(37)-N6)-threonylcarbamoyltransferase complex ATPase subunit type 1 TsaE n=1 Tax=uncultured Salinicola sp. TaxID=1193542 RepID=UPI000C8B831F|nr:tRNA (adenosine(37)-N6)-threonylcarbamoyltransferase complex ATPase subunit type 1 TsaE [uncultured Salinicola sp.]MAM57865.1 tRNA (adenosine(37)-N6)-threonylcarbamoyltransferase complex ATPase subunit type 1 TsaE [Salinicola sp.]|tara:strand:- start:1160 stop:1639 length:480 start_codon:yes stop_codon:yes gene_type:complete